LLAGMVEGSSPSRVYKREAGFFAGALFKLLLIFIFLLQYFNFCNRAQSLNIQKN